MKGACVAPVEGSLKKHGSFLVVGVCRALSRGPGAASALRTFMPRIAPTSLTSLPKVGGTNPSRVRLPPVATAV